MNWMFEFVENEVVQLTAKFGYINNWTNSESEGILWTSSRNWWLKSSEICNNDVNRIICPHRRSPSKSENTNTEVVVIDKSEIECNSKLYD